jgi:hypothetical protein
MMNAAWQDNTMREWSSLCRVDRPMPFVSSEMPGVYRMKSVYQWTGDEPM